MISRLAETGDSESSEPHVSVVKETSNTTECHVASNEGHQKTNEAIQLKVFETEDNDSNQGDCTLAVSLSHVSAQYGVSSKTESESSNNFMKCSSVTETVNAMTTNTPDVHKNDDSEQSIQHKLRNYSEQESNFQELCVYDDPPKEYIAKSASAVSTLTKLISDGNPIGSIRVISCETASSSDDDVENPSMDVIHEVCKLTNSSSAEYHPVNKSHIEQELDSVSVSELLRRSCDDINIAYLKNCKSNVSVVKCSPSKTSVNSYVKYVPSMQSKQNSLQGRTTTSLPPTSAVLNPTHSLHKVKSNPQVYKVQNVIVKPSAQNANGYITQYGNAIHPTTSQTYSEVNINPTNQTSVSSNYFSKKQALLDKEAYQKRNRKILFGNQSLQKDSSIEHVDMYQSQTNYSNKLPNIISKVRDNLLENPLKSKANKVFLNPSDKYSEHTRVVRKYEPKFSSNTLNMDQTKLLKKNRPDYAFSLNRNSLTDKHGDIGNVYTESVALEPHSGLPATSILLNQETYSRKNIKQNIRTGQNNNIDVLPNNWKQKATIGGAVVPENVTPISTSNTWDEIPRLNYSLSQEPVSAKFETSTIIKQTPQILIVRGDSQAPPQRVGCGDEEFIGEEIRPQRTDHLPPAYHSLQIVLQDHNYGAPPPSSVISPMPEMFSNTSNPVEHIPSFNTKTLRKHEDEDAASVVSIESHNHLNNEEDEETETAPEEENETSDVVDDKNSITRCICDFQHDDGYMIQCGQCLVWQHIVCVGVTPKRIPKKYLCDFCQPRELDRYRAHSLQKMIRDDLNMLTSSDSSPTRSGDKDRVSLKNITKRRGESSVNFPVAYSTTRNKRIRRDPSPKVKVRRPYKERKKVFRKKVKTDMDRPSVRPWLENYELAITNHYSQELRARLSGITKKQEEPPHFVLTDCTTIPFAGGRIMISTIDILPNTPVIELMGKFMLSSQHQNATALLVGTNSRQVTQKPGPFVFFYRMPQEGADICIDTRTYGNDARFVRRSCKPNCELHHWFDKGTLHIFLMSIEKIESNTEITLRHELGWHGLGIGRTPSNPCACNSPECLLLNPIQNRKSYSSNDNAPSKLRVNKTRAMTSRSYMVKDKLDSPKSDCSPEDDADEDMSAPSKSIDDDHQSDFRATPVKSSQDSDNTSDDLRKIMASCADARSEVDESPKSSIRSEERTVKPSFSKDEPPPTTRRTRRAYTRRNRVNKKLVLQDSSPPEAKPSGESGDEVYNDTNVKDMKKMTREERKIAQVMKVFDRLEKDKAKRSSGAPRGRRRDSESDHTRRDESTDVEHNSTTVRVYRTRGKGRRKNQVTRDYKQKTRRSLSEGGSDDLSSIRKSTSVKSSSEGGKNADLSDTDPNPETAKSSSPAKIESEKPMQGPSKRGLRRRKIVFPKKQHVNIEEGQPGQQTEEAAGLLLALARSTPANPSDPSPSNEILESPISNMISVCQLVEAAVGPLETSLKSPKKAILNEWMNKSPESTLAYDIQDPTPVAYNECNSNSNSPLTLFSLGNESAQNRSIPSSKLLDTLVQAASSICDIGNEYPESESNIIKDKLKLDSHHETSAESCKTLMEEKDLDEKSKIIGSMLDVKSNILLEPPVIGKSSPLPLIDNDIAKNEFRTVIQINHAKEEKSISSNESSNITLQPLTSPFTTSDANSVLQNHIPDSEETMLESTVQNDAYESINLNISESPCTAEVSVKSSVIDISTDLSNDSNNVYSSYQGNNSGSAKKRWLHQALSEESDHPLSKSSTPLKKRRVVRESTSEIVHLSNDDVNEFTVDAKNFQSATTVATSSDGLAQASLQNKNTVVAELNTNTKSLNRVENEANGIESNIANHKSLIHSLNSKNAFDWENLENHEEAFENSIVNETLPINSLNSLSEAECSETVDTLLKHMSPEIADIHKQLQSFHSENIQVLRSRNQKPKIFEGPRKKVNLMFEVSILEDETVAVELCSESKSSCTSKAPTVRPQSPNKETVEPQANSTQIISYDFEEFSRHESRLLQQHQDFLNAYKVDDYMYMDDNELSTSSLPNYSTMSLSDSSICDLKEPQSQDDMCVNTTKFHSDKHSSLLSFKDIPTKLETNMQMPLCSPTNTLINKHEIGVAARARLDSILNATDISQDAMFDQVLKKSLHTPNHVTNVIRVESPVNSPIPAVQTSNSKPMARTSSSDPRLQQAAPIKKKLSLTEYRARKKTDTNGNGNDVYSSSEKTFGQMNVLISDVDEEPNDQENFMFTPEPTLVERELEKHPGFLSRDFFNVPSSITNDLANESETEGSGSDP